MTVARPADIVETRPAPAGLARVRVGAAIVAIAAVLATCALMWVGRASVLDEFSATSARRAGRLAIELRQSLDAAGAVIAGIEGRLARQGDTAAALAEVRAAAAVHAPLMVAQSMPWTLHPVLQGDALAVPTELRWHLQAPRNEAGAWVVPMLRPAAPNPHGVRGWRVDLDHAALLRRFESFRQHEGGGVALFRVEPDASITLLARTPFDPGELGRTVRGPLADALAKAPRGQFDAVTQLDPTRRLVAYTRLDGDAASMVVANGVEKDQLLAAWRRQLPWAAGTLALVLGAIGAGARSLQRSLRALAEQRDALALSESHFRALADNLPDVVVRLDSQGRHQYANPAVEGASGLPPEAFLGKTNAELGMQADKVELWMACLRRVFGTGQSERLEFDFEGPRGAQHWESVVALEPHAAGKPTTALVISRDITERVLGERERQRLASILEATSDIVGMADTEGHLIYLNGPGRAMLGVGPEGSLPEVIANVHPQWAADLILSEGLQAAIQQGRWSGETAVLGPGGQEIPVSQVILSHKDPQGKLLFLSTIMRDIRASRAAQLALQASEQRLREAQQLASIGSWTLDMRSGALDWSDEVFRIFELDPAHTEPRFQLFEGAVHPDDRGATEQAWQRAIAEHGDYAMTHRLLLPDGRVKHVHARGRCSYAADGTPLHALGTVQDVTVRVQAEQALRDSEGRFRALVELSSDWYWQTDAEHRFVLREGAVLGRMGIPASDDYGLRRWEMPDYINMTEADWAVHRAALERREEFRDLLLGRRSPDGRVHWATISGRPYIDAQGAFAGYHGIGRDITQQVLAQQALRGSEERLRLALEAAHQGLYDLDLRTGHAVVSPEYARMLGWEPEAFDETNAAWLERLHPDDRAGVEQVFTDYMAGRRSDYRVEFRQRMRDGGWKWILSVGRVQERAADGTPLRMLGTHTDLDAIKAAQAAELAATQRFEKLFTAAPEAMSVSVLASGLILQVNDAYCELFAFPREAVIGRTSLELGMWTRAEGRDGLVARLRAGESVQGFEGVARRGDGEKIDVMFSAERIDLDGRECLLLMFRDISERKRLDAALRASEQRFRLAASFGQVWEWDFGAGGVAPTSEFFITLGYGEVTAEKQQAMFIRVVDPEDLHRMRECLARHLKRQGPYHMQFRAVDAQGRDRWFETQGQAVWDDSGRATYIAGTTFEITERREAEEQVRRMAAELEQRVERRTAQLAESEARYRTIFETVPVAIGEEDWSGVQQRLRALRAQGVTDGPAHFAARPDFVRDCLGAVKIRNLNRKALMLHGLEEAPSTLAELKLFFPTPAFELPFAENLAAMWSGRRQYATKLSLTSASGQALSLMMTMSLPGLDDAQGTALVCLVDITEIDRLNAELDLSLARLTQVNRELETFTYSVSHDLKAPLRGIDGYSRLLLDEYRDRLDDEGRAFLGYIRQATQHMGVLIDDLLAYSRLERRELTLASLPLAGVANAALAGLRADLAAAGVLLTLRIDPALRARGDAQGLTMALRNLVDNALKFSRGRTPPAITISATRSEHAVRLEVHDNGVGFDMKFHDRIFSIFQRLHRAEDYPGTGIGLAIVRKAVDRMGGRVWATSRPGQGATFTIELPEAE